jgi:polyhydroxybutyrate depolymerase
LPTTENSVQLHPLTYLCRRLYLISMRTGILRSRYKRNFLSAGTARSLRRCIGAALVAVFLLGLPMLAYSSATGSRERIESGERTRRYILYVPDSYDPVTPTALVISLHGFMGWAAQQQRLSGWNAVADRYGFIVVYPQGTDRPRRWNAEPSPTDPDGLERDVQFISDLIDHVAAQYQIDESRVYVTGMSNGAGMAFALACTIPERIAAIGGVAGAYRYPWDSCESTEPVPVIVFHGTDDPVVPYEGGLGGIFRHHAEFRPVEEWVTNWVERNGCSADPEVLPAVGQVTGVRYTGGRHGADVLFYTVHCGGHTWPGGKRLPQRLVGHTTQDVDASELMWEFFAGLPR